jgi:hypothetical protein
MPEFSKVDKCARHGLRSSAIRLGSSSLTKRQTLLADLGFAWGRAGCSGAKLETGIPGGDAKLNFFLRALPEVREGPSGNSGFVPNL